MCHLDVSAGRIKSILSVLDVDTVTSVSLSKTHVFTFLRNLENLRRLLPVVGFDYDGSSYMRSRCYFLCTLRRSVNTQLYMQNCTVQPFLNHEDIRENGIVTILSRTRSSNSG